MSATLVTGAAGFLGGEVVRALRQQGVEVVGTDNFDPFYPREVKLAHLASTGLEGDDFHELDILDTASLAALMQARGVDVLVHLAAKAGVRPSLADPAAYARVNVLGTASCIQAAEQAGVSRVVFASSSSVYGERARGPFREGDGDEGVDRPISPYAWTKRAGELALRTHTRLSGLRTMALRFFTAYGPWQRPDLAIHRFARQIWNGDEVTIYGDGSMARDFTYVADIVSGVVAARGWTGEVPPGTYEVLNLGCGEPVTVLETVDRLEEALGRPARRVFLDRPAGDVSVTHASIERAGEVLGYQPSTTFSRGVAEFAAWFQERAG
jgi:UDP-glucuronate 4-epimerase